MGLAVPQEATPTSKGLIVSLMTHARTLADVLAKKAGTLGGQVVVTRDNEFLYFAN